MGTPTACIGWARSTALRADTLRVVELPVFLCPILARPALRKRVFRSLYPLPSYLSQQPARLFNSVSHQLPKESHHKSIQDFNQLPRQCAGCGALSHTSENGEPGFYSLRRRSVKEFLAPASASEISNRLSERDTIEASLRNLGDEALKPLSFDAPATAVQQKEAPLCDRCHKLLHHQSGVSIHHPSIESIQDTILESPHKYNHVYHVIDAADFPMSLIPRLHQRLHLVPQRSLNRRSKTEKFSHGRKSELSFIITRSDLLAPLKTQVDSLMPYLVSVLRDALGSMGKDARLGNVRCVSAKRGWWTKELKQEIWKRGGGGWMVGKVNVGKSQLFESVFPKGRHGLIRIGQPLLPTALDDHIPSTENSEFSRTIKVPGFSPDTANKPSTTELYDSNLLLPPLQSETDYPAMPLVSSLPGTTASPIRVPFGDGKGELVDLPGISRGDLELFVQEPHRPSLVMRARIRPDQQVIKPGQSLLLGGFIRITPKSPDIIILAYAFTSLSAHLTSTEKAIGIQTQQRESGVENIAVVGVGEKVRSAGNFPLKWDVTKQRSGPITAPDAADIKVSKLPYRVLSTDIIIEGCGWVELVVQVRAKTLESLSRPPDAFGSDSINESFGNPQFPEVEVFSPEGSFIAARRPLGAWALSGQMKPAARMKIRPRKSMKGMKKKMKALARTAGT